MMCPYDELQCEHPKCLSIWRPYADEECQRRYIEEQAAKPSVNALAAHMKDRASRLTPTGG